MYELCCLDITTRSANVRFAYIFIYAGQVECAREGGPTDLTAGKG